MTEKLKTTELNPELVRAYSQSFIPRWDCYPSQQANGRYIQVKNPLTTELVTDHLLCHYTGQEIVTLGAYALDPGNQAQWICLDADDNPQWEKLWRLAHQLKADGVHPYLEPSRRGGHLWLFILPAEGQQARRFGKALLQIAGDPQIELYPKQDRLLEGAGSFVRLPLGVHRKSGRIYPFIGLDGEPIAATIREQIQMLINPIRVPSAYFAQVASHQPKEPLPSPTPSFERQTPGSGETLSEALKNTISVHSFVGRFVELDQHGRGLCPFHEDEIKSFQVNIQRNYWHCYAGCGGGSIIDFWMRRRARHGEDDSFAETVKDLREMLIAPPIKKKKKRQS